MSGMQRRVVRSREQSLILLAIAIIAPLVGFIQLSDEEASAALSLGARVGLMLPVVLLATFAFRLSRSGVVVTENGVIIKSPIRSNSFRWEEIVGFSLRRRGLFPGIGHVELNDGRVIPIYGISVPNPTTRPNNRSAQLLVSELNGMLSDARRGRAPK